MPAGQHFRTHERRPVRLSAVLRHLDGSFSARVHVTDLSLAGACLELRERLTPGVAVALEIVAPTLWDPLLVVGQIVWTGAPSPKGTSRVGVRFDADEPGPLFALFEVLAANAYE